MYRIADRSVEHLWHALLRTVEARLPELDAVVRDYMVGLDDFEPIDRTELMRRLKAGTVTLIDVRPAEEYEAAHIPGAVSVPLDKISAFAKTAGKRKTIVAYCRGPYCVLSLQAVAALRKRGLNAMHAKEGISEWRTAGLPVERGERAAP